LLTSAIALTPQAAIHIRCSSPPSHNKLSVLCVCGWGVAVNITGGSGVNRSVGRCAYVVKDTVVRDCDADFTAT
jgi:hypothetical protein